MINKWHEELLALADEKHAIFASKLIPRAKLPLLGIKIPQLRILAKKLAASSDWLDYLNHIATFEYHEERMLAGLLIGYLPADIKLEQRLQLIELILPYFDDWSLCDTNAKTYKFVKKEAPRVWEWLQDYILSNDQTKARFGVVMMLTYYSANADYTQAMFDVLPKVIDGSYYVEMAVAWCCCELYIRFPQETRAFLNRNTLPCVTRKMAEQKIRDSNRCY